MRFLKARRLVKHCRLSGRQRVFGESFSIVTLHDFTLDLLFRSSQRQSFFSRQETMQGRELRAMKQQKFYGL